MRSSLDLFRRPCIPKLAEERATSEQVAQYRRERSKYSKQLLSTQARFSLKMGWEKEIKLSWGTKTRRCRGVEFLQAGQIQEITIKIRPSSGLESPDSEEPQKLQV